MSNRSAVRRVTVGPRMAELLMELASEGGRARSKHAAYVTLRYHGKPSIRFGSAVLARAIDAGLIRTLPREGDRVPVELTRAGLAIGQLMLKRSGSDVLWASDVVRPVSDRIPRYPQDVTSVWEVVV